MSSKSLNIFSLDDAVFVESQNKGNRINNRTLPYNMVSLEERMEIINRIENNEIDSECKSGQRQKWWKKGNKHHPEQEIPRDIYLLGRGTLQELHNNYNKRYSNGTPIEYSKFINYTRELVKQKIMYI